MSRVGRICKEVAGERCPGGGGLLGAPEAKVARQTQLRSGGVSKPSGVPLGERSARLAMRKTERKVNERRETRKKERQWKI